MKVHYQQLLFHKAFKTAKPYAALFTRAKRFKAPLSIVKKGMTKENGGNTN